MTLITETVTIDSKNYKHIYSDAGYYVKRNDNKLFMDVLEPTSSTYTYTETTQLATQQLLSRMMARMSTLETKHNNLEGLPHVVETYSNGTDWYRVYSDKWCEQGGRSSIIADYGTGTITLHKAYKDINYNITTEADINATGDDASWMGSYYIQYPNKTTNSFKIYSRGALGGGRYINWRASGYIN